MSQIVNSSKEKITVSKDKVSSLKSIFKFTKNRKFFVGVKKVVIWAPRVMGILFTVFIGLFATEAFNEGYSFFKTVLAFLIQLIPAIMVLSFTLAGWRWRSLGGMLFIILGTVYLFILWGQPWQTMVIISGPLYLIAALFLVDKTFDFQGKK